jgi:hypothetical protein
MINNKLQIIMVKLTTYVFNLTKDDVKILKKVFLITYSLLKNNGTKFTINYLKQSRLLITRYLCKKRIYRNTHFISSKNGFPNKFIFLKKYIDSGQTNQIKFCLTLMNLSRAIELRKNDDITPDISSIIDPSPCKRNYTIPGWFIKSWISSNNLNLVQPRYTVQDFFLSLKMGPHGPSVLSMMESIKWLTHNQLVSMKILIDNEDFFVKYIGRLYSFFKHNTVRIPRGSELYDIYHEAENYPQITGRIAIVKDPEYKLRLIAILDYMSQFILKPIHEQLLGLLSRLPCDRTFTQDPKHNWKGEDRFHSLDLSSATDRFPISLQQKLIQYLFEPEKTHKLIGSYWFAKAWRDLISQRDFLFEGKLIRYSVGQPMGSYSSWAAFTITHHLVVAWAAYISIGDRGFTNYIILGDDIVIKNDKVAKAYTKVMHKLGVSISPHKTHVSKNTYEFAKRWIRWIDTKFIELSPIPIKGIALNIKNPYIVYTILFDYFIIKGNQYLVRGGIRNLICRLYSNITFTEYDRKSKKVKKLSFRIPYLRQKINLLDFGMRHSLGLNTYDRAREIFAYYSYKTEWYPIPNESTIHLEIKRVLKESVQFVLNDRVGSISKLKSQVLAYFDLFKIKDRTIFESFPIINAIFNYLQRLEVYTNTLNDHNFDYVSFVKEIHLDFSELSMWNRNYHNTVLNGSKLWSKGFSALSNELDAQMYYIRTETWINCMKYNLSEFKSGLDIRSLSQTSNEDPHAFEWGFSELWPKTFKEIVWNSHPKQRPKVRSKH